MPKVEKRAYSRMVYVVSITRFLDVNDGLYYYDHRLRRFSKDDMMGIEVIIVSRQKLFRKGQMVKVFISRRE
jgi:hypothetical protein